MASISVPGKLGYAGNTRGLRRVLTEIVTTLDEIEGMSAAEVQAVVDAALAGLGGVVRTGEVELLGITTPVTFDADGVAILPSGGRDAFSAVSDADECEVTVDGGTPASVAVAGTNVVFSGGTSVVAPGTIVAGVDKKFRIQVDQDVDANEWQEVSIADWTGAATEAEVAARLQYYIQALGVQTTGADYSQVAVAWSTDHYQITGNAGSECKIEIGRASELDLVDELDWGDNASITQAGAGNLDYLRKPTLVSLAALFSTALTAEDVDVVVEDDKVKVKSHSTGATATLSISDATGTPADNWGFTVDTTVYGGIGLGMPDMDDTEYGVFLQVLDTSPSHVYSVDGRATTGFTVTANGDATGAKLMVAVVE